MRSKKKYICPYQLWCGHYKCPHSKPHSIPIPDGVYCNRAPCTNGFICSEFSGIEAVCIEVEEEE